jgi:hypothetical protein
VEVAVDATVIVLVIVLVMVEVTVEALLEEDPTTYPPPTATMATIITTPATSAELNPCLWLNFIYGELALHSGYMACRNILLRNIVVPVVYGCSILYCAAVAFVARF